MNIFLYNIKVLYYFLLILIINYTFSMYIIEKIEKSKKKIFVVRAKRQGIRSSDFHVRQDTEKDMRMNVNLYGCFVTKFHKL